CDKLQLLCKSWKTAPWRFSSRLASVAQANLRPNDAADLKNLLGWCADEHAAAPRRLRPREPDSPRTRFSRAPRAFVDAEEKSQTKDRDRRDASARGFHTSLCNSAPRRCRHRLPRRQLAQSEQRRHHLARRSDTRCGVVRELPEDGSRREER